VLPLKSAKVDTVILGCTHYPLIAHMLRRLLGANVALIDSAEEIARKWRDPDAQGYRQQRGPGGRLPLSRQW